MCTQGRKGKVSVHTYWAMWGFQDLSASGSAFLLDVNGFGRMQLGSRPGTDVQLMVTHFVICVVLPGRYPSLQSSTSVPPYRLTDSAWWRTPSPSLISYQCLPHVPFTVYGGHSLYWLDKWQYLSDVYQEKIKSVYHRALRCKATLLQEEAWKEEEEGIALYRHTVAYRTYTKFTCRHSMKETLQDAL